MTRHRWYNRLQSALLIAAMAMLAGYLGWVLVGAEGLFLALVAALLFGALGPRISPRFVLRVAGAVEIAPAQAPALYAALAVLAQRAGLPRPPRLFYVPTRILNAFAAGGPGESAIAVTDGILRRLDPRELAGVLAHEIAHIRANDVWVMTLADFVGRLTVVLSTAGQILLVVLLPLSVVAGLRLPLMPIVVLILAPTVSAVLQLALSRTRELDADLAAADLTGDPAGLASALDKLERLQGGWVERMFSPSWLRTHPDTARRVRRLLEIERRQRQSRTRALPPWDGDALFRRPAVVRRPRWHWHGTWY